MISGLLMVLMLLMNSRLVDVVVMFDWFRKLLVQVSSSEQIGLVILFMMVVVVISFQMFGCMKKVISVIIKLISDRFMMIRWWLLWFDIQLIGYCSISLFVQIVVIKVEILVMDRFLIEFQIEVMLKIVENILFIRKIFMQFSGEMWNSVVKFIGLMVENCGVGWCDSRIGRNDMLISSDGIRNSRQFVGLVVFISSCVVMMFSICMIIQVDIVCLCVLLWVLVFSQFLVVIQMFEKQNLISSCIIVYVIQCGVKV